MVPWSGIDNSRSWHWPFDGLHPRPSRNNPDETLLKPDTGRQVLQEFDWLPFHLLAWMRGGQGPLKYSPGWHVRQILQQVAVGAHFPVKHCWGWETWHCHAPGHGEKRLPLMLQWSSIKSSSSHWTYCPTVAVLLRKFPDTTHNRSISISFYVYRYIYIYTYTCTHDVALLRLEVSDFK